MAGVATRLLLAHLMGVSWHIEDQLLYGGARVGLMLGTGLSLWGRLERQHNPAPSDEANLAGNAARLPHSAITAALPIDEYDGPF